MLKRVLLFIALFGLLAAPVNAVTVDWYEVWYENRIYDNNYNSAKVQAYLAFSVGLLDVVNPVPVFVDSDAFDNPMELFHQVDGEYWRTASPYPNPLVMDKYETTYDFSIQGVSSSPSVTIPDGTFRLLPYAIPIFNDGMVSWNAVAGNEIKYRLKIWEFLDGESVGPRLFASDNISETFYDLSFLDLGEYSLRLEAKEIFGGTMINRSSSYAYMNKPVPEPATILLLGSGLIGLAGFGRKKIFKK